MDIVGISLGREIIHLNDFRIINFDYFTTVFKLEKQNKP